MLSDLVERVYAFALLNLEPDENVLGLLFLFSPFLLLFLKKRNKNLFLLVTGELLIFSRLIEPLVQKQGIYILAGISVASFFLFFPSYLFGNKNNERIGINFSIGLAFAVALSIFFRSLNSSIDISLVGLGQIAGWFLGIPSAITLVVQFFQERQKPNDLQEEQLKPNFWKVLLLAMGVISLFITIWFTFVSPAVISRWTEGNYFEIEMGLLIMLAIFVTISLWKPVVFNSLKNWMIWAWNGLFTVSLTLTIVVNQIFFPKESSAYPLVFPNRMWYHFVPLVLMILFSPIIYLDFMFLIREIKKLQPTNKQLAGSFTISGGLYITIMIFVQILPNVWGYLPPISLGFRDMYWLAFFLPTLILSLSLLIVKFSSFSLENFIRLKSGKIQLNTFFATLFIGTMVGTLVLIPQPNHSAVGKESLIIMTFNIQQGVNVTGDRNYDNQIALIKKVDPDILGLQECDPTRISGGNNDIVRYFASKLNMYSYYGPNTVTNTYGCAILSKFPLSNEVSFFMYSDEEQIGSAQAQVTVGTKNFNVFVNHPSGSHEAKILQQQQMLSRVNGLSNVIFMGDFNFRVSSQEYNDTVAVLDDSWFLKWPTGMDNQGYSTIEEGSIDHIFLSHGFTVLKARYIEPGQSDHPAYWIEIQL
ncbi:MAG: endonuclease/exonuclease/phosphatase family protein [Candidatus Heimdallarchaeaceae archaeon]